VKILVIGGAGYIGSVLVLALLEHGYRVDVLDIGWFGSVLTLASLPRDAHQLKEHHLERYDQVINLAGVSNDPMAEHDPARNFVDNGALAAHIAYTAKRAGVRRLIYASSCSVYGYTVNELYDEQSPTPCTFPYGISKLQGECGVMHLQDSTFSVIALRKGTVCGYSPRMRFDLLVNTMYKCAVTDGKITVSNASLWRPVLDIRDCVAAYLRAVQANYSVSGVFNVASQNCTVGHVADRVKDTLLMDYDIPCAVEIQDVQDLRNYKVSTQRARNTLNFEPRYEIGDIVRSIHENRAEYGDINADKYYNIRVFKGLTP